MIGAIEPDQEGQHGQQRQYDAGEGNREAEQSRFSAVENGVEGPYEHQPDEEPTNQKNDSTLSIKRRGAWSKEHQPVRQP